MPIRTIFYGTPDFAAKILEALLNSPEVMVGAVVTREDKPAGRGRHETPPPVKVLAESKNIPVIQPKSIRKNEAEFLNEASKYGPFDIGVVAAFGQILPKAALDLPIRGSINIHASLLPRWRGAAPIQRAIMSGDSKTGVCLMHMDEGLDTGDVYSKQEIPIGPTDNAGTIHDKLADIGAKILVKDIADIVSGTITSKPQSSDGITYAEKITNEESEINWNSTAQEIDRRIRSLAPSPGAFTLLNGLRLKIFGAVPKNETTNAIPGTVLRIDNRTLEVGCREGVLSLTELQLEGRKRLPVEEFLKGAPIAQGIVLGR